MTGMCKPLCLDNLRVIVMHSRGDDHHIDILQIFRTMADADLRPETAKPLRYIATAKIGTGYLVAKVQKHLGNPAHADPADADEMYLFDFSVHKFPSDQMIFALRQP